MPSQAFVSDLLGRRAGNILCNTHTTLTHTHTRARELPRVDKRHWERTPCTISRVLVNGGTFISRHLPLLSALTCKSRAWPGQPRDSSSHCARSLSPLSLLLLVLPNDIGRYYLVPSHCCTSNQAPSTLPSSPETYYSSFTDPRPPLHTTHTRFLLANRDVNCARAGSITVQSFLALSCCDCFTETIGLLLRFFFSTLVNLLIDWPSNFSSPKTRDLRSPDYISHSLLPYFKTIFSR